MEKQEARIFSKKLRKKTDKNTREAEKDLVGQFYKDCENLRCLKSMEQLLSRKIF